MAWQMDLEALQEQADALQQQVANLTTQNEDLQQASSDVSNQASSDELPTWGLAVFAVLGLLGVCICLTLAFVLQRERVGKPIFKPLNPGIPVTTSARASGDDVQPSKTDNV